MSTPPDGKHATLRDRLRREAAQMPGVLVASADLITLLDYIDELQEAEYSAWENFMGEDL